MRTSAPWIILCIGLVMSSGGCRKEQSAPKSHSRDKKEKKAAVKAEKKETPGRTFGTEPETGRTQDVPVDPLARYRTGLIDVRVRQVPPRIQAGVFSNPETHLNDLVRFLVAETDDDFLKVKLIHDWVADNISYDVKGYFSGNLPRTDWKGTLTTGSSVCDGYSTLFDTMCSAAGIESRKVSGYGRGYSFKLFGSEDVYDSDHAWNAVEIYDEWYLVDTTWDAGHVSGKDFEKDYSTEYLLMPPEQFIYRHFPEEPEWQLLDPPLTAAEFVDLPYIRGDFFSLGLEFTQPVGRANRTSRETELTLRLPRSTAIMANVATERGDKRADCTLLQRNADTVTIRAVFPGRGNWVVDVFARPGRQEGSYSSVASIGYTASRGSRSRFARTFATYTSLGCSLIEPLHAPLAPGETRFAIRVPGASAVSVVTADRDWNSLSKGEGDLFTGTVSVPGSGPTEIVVQTQQEQSRWQVLAEY